MADLFNIKKPNEEPIENIFDLLTPEEKAQYAKNLQPTTGERVLTGVGGLADVISSAGGGRNDHYYGSNLQERSDKRIGQDMQFVGNELTRKYAERQAKAAAEKAQKESAGVGEELGQIFNPQYFDNPNVGSEDKLKIAQFLNQQQIQKMKPKPQGRAPKDMSYWWLNTSKAAINDPRIKPLYEQNIGFAQVNDLLNQVRSGNTVAAAGLGKKMATAMGEGGRTTDEDVVRYVKSGKLSQSAGDKLSKWLNGVPSDATTEEVQQIVDVLSNEYNTKVIPVYDEYVERAGNIQEVPYEQAASKLNLPGSTYNKKTTPTVDKVKVKDANGKMFMLPASQLEAAKKKGYTQVQ